MMKFDSNKDRILFTFLAFYGFVNSSFIHAQNQFKQSKIEFNFILSDSTVATYTSQAAFVGLYTNIEELYAQLNQNNPKTGNLKIDSLLGTLKFNFNSTLQPPLSQILASQNTGTVFQLVGTSEINNIKDQISAQISFVNLKNRGQTEDLKADLSILCSSENLKNPILKQAGIIAYNIQILGANLNTSIK
jgi:hypothetical protein